MGEIPIASHIATHSRASRSAVERRTAMRSVPALSFRSPSYLACLIASLGFCLPLAAQVASLDKGHQILIDRGLPIGGVIALTSDPFHLSTMQAGGSKELLRELDCRLLELRRDLIEDVCEGRIKGDQVIANILTLLKDARRNLPTLEAVTVGVDDRLLGNYRSSQKAA